MYHDMDLIPVPEEAEEMENVKCDICRKTPLQTWFRCNTCAAYDVCEDCHVKNLPAPVTCPTHTVEHRSTKMFNSTPWNYGEMNSTNGQKNESQSPLNDNENGDDISSPKSLSQAALELMSSPTN